MAHFFEIFLQMQIKLTYFIVEIAYPSFTGMESTKQGNLLLMQVKLQVGQLYSDISPYEVNEYSHAYVDNEGRANESKSHTFQGWSPSYKTIQ